MQEHEKSLAVVEKEGQLLMFHTPNEDTTIPVKMVNETMWLTQDQMAKLFHIDRTGITKHLANIFANEELNEKSNVQFLHIVNSDKPVKHYNLDVIISVGYRVNSKIGTQFRIWATGRLKEYMIKGYALDKDRLSTLGSKYFDELVEKVREIRTSERESYRKITGIFTTSKDYNPNSETAQKFFATVQNKLHYAIHGHTAAELIVERADSQKDHMGLTNWKGKKDITKADAIVAKNYLDRIELKLLTLLGEQFLSFAEFQYTDQKSLYMKDWEKKLNELLILNDRQILSHRGMISREEMEHRIDEEIKKYKITKKPAINQTKFRRGYQAHLN